MILPRPLLVACAGLPLFGACTVEESSSTTDVHQGYSDTADQYEVDGLVISNVDPEAWLWNPRGKTAEQIAARAAFLADSYDWKRTPEQQQRAQLAQEKYGDAIVINSVMPSAVGVVNVTEDEFAKGLKRNLDAGVTLVSCTVFAFPGDGDMELIERFENSIKVIKENGYILVESVDDIRRAKRDGNLAVTFNTQGADYAVDDMEIMERVHGLGLRVSNFVYNKNNALAGGGAAQDMGVTELGEQWVQICNELGVVVDISHSSNQTAIDAARLSSRPIVASHSCCAALYDIGRNMNDAAVKAVGESGGVIATTAVGLFLNAEGDASPTQFARHIEHTANLIGRDKTGFSTDYMHNAATMFADNVNNVDIYPPEKGFGGPATNLAAEHVWDIVAVLEDEHGWSEEEVRGFLGENLLRVYAANWK